MSKKPMIFTACLLAAGCGGRFVRTPGRGTTRVIAAPKAAVYEKALAQFRDLPSHTVTERDGSIYIHNKAGFLYMAFHFPPEPDPNKTAVEITARTWVFSRMEERRHEGKVLDYLELNFVPGGPEFLARMKGGDVAAQIQFQRSVGLPKTDFTIGDPRKLLPAPESLVDAPMPPKPERPDDFAIVVGVESYQNAPAADWAERDAGAVRQTLRGLGVPERNLITLTGTQATRSGLSRYLLEWLPKNVNRNSRVYFYFSGHGAPDPETNGAFLLPWDGDPAYLKTSALELQTLYATLAKLPAKESVVLLDACFSGAGGRSVIAKGTRPLISVREAAPSDPKVIVFSAADSGQIAGASDEEGHGLFTYHVLSGIQGAASPGSDGRLSLEELRDFTAGRVAQEALRQNRKQTPRLQGDGASVFLF